MLWNTGVIHISSTGKMTEGMLYETRSAALGQQITAKIRVDRLSEPEQIVIHNDTGAVVFMVTYDLLSKPRNHCHLVCTMDFDLKGIAWQFAHPVIESIAKTRLSSDLQTLRTLLTQTESSEPS